MKHLILHWNKETYKKDFIKIFFAILFSFSFSLYSIEYKIVKANFLVDGITRKTDIERTLPIDKNKVFNNLDEIEIYAKDYEQKLLNTRLFTTAEVKYNTEKYTDDVFNVSLEIKVIDSKHFICIPYPKYDSNEGFILKLKMKDTNFIATMNPMESELSFTFEQKNGSTRFKPGATFVYNLPFKIGIVNASWNNDYAFKYTLVENISEWNMNTGFTFSIPLQYISFDFNFTQASVRDLDYLKYGDDTYFTEKASFSSPIKLDTINNWGDILYTPKIAYVWNWDKDGINIHNEDLSSPLLTFSHGISTKRINWIGNFRQGLSLNLEQSIAYDFLVNEFKPGISGEILAFKAFTHFGINGRLYAYGNIGKSEKIGNRLRGIKDEQYFSKNTNYSDSFACKTSSALILNLDFPIKLFSMNWKKAKVLNFEVQVSPFIDIALMDNKATGTGFYYKDGFYTAGFEVLVFPEKWNSIQLRASAGIDLSKNLLKNVLNTSWRDNASMFEILIGIGLFY